MFKEVKAIGFDLDQTLYPDKQEIQDRIRTEIAKKMLEKRPELASIPQARAYFEQEYARLHSGRQVLRQLGYDGADRIMDHCVAKADIIGLIEKNDELPRILQQLKERRLLFLITSGGEELANKKLEKIGINPALFDIRVYSDTQNAGWKQDGTAFEYLLKHSRFSPELHLYVGNSLNADILPAQGIGMKTLAVWSKIPEADHSIQHINDIGRVLL